MNSITTLTSDVVVVDQHPRDYVNLIAGAARRKLRIRLFKSGDEAIHSASVFFDGLWLINTRLPDMSGIDLLRLIRERDPTAAIFLVSDSSDLGDEILARSAGPTAYVCKPPQPAWLSSLRPDLRVGSVGQFPTERHYTLPQTYCLPR